MTFVKLFNTSRFNELLVAQRLRSLSYKLLRTEVVQQKRLFEQENYSTPKQM